MVRLNNKPLRFVWRASRNLLCLVPVGRRLLFPQEQLAVSFGRGDAEYAWDVFQHHFTKLRNAGFTSAKWILEVGPGRNLGTALLWWAYCGICRDTPAEVVCWDVFKNTTPEISGFWGNLAQELLDALPGGLQEVEMNSLQARLHQVTEGFEPQITYCVKSLVELEAAMNARHTQFDLVYSQVAIEHIWDIEAFWETMVRLTRSGGWHSHCIDLADHGRRDTNYIEMLEWSRLAWWLSMRFIPGAINRWRAVHHSDKLEALGMQLVDANREIRDRLPIKINRVSGEFRRLGKEELRTTTLDVVGVRLG